MPWGRVSDDAYTYPKLLAVAGIPGAPDYAVNEVFGFFQACILQSAGHVTDYVINKGAVQTAGRARWKKVLAWAERVELLVPIELDGMEHWVLHNDPKFIHIRTKAELDAEDRKRDVLKKPHLAVAVRLRDGDGCRYCGLYVIWDGRKSLRSGELDHRDPNSYAEVPDDLVVACRSCNGSRQDNEDTWDAANPLRPVPTTPIYGEPTAAWLTANGHPTEPNVEHDVLLRRGKASSSQRAAATTAAPQAAQTAPNDQDASTDGAPDWAAAATERSAEPVDGDRGTPEERSPNAPFNGDTGSIGTGSAGSGRDGSGQAPGSGPGPITRNRKKRGRRGRGGGRGPKPNQPAAPPCSPECPNPYPHTDEDGSVLCLTCETRSPR